MTSTTEISEIMSVSSVHDKSPRGMSSAASTAASSDLEHEVPKARPTKLFIGGLTKNTTTKLLREHFSKYGRVMDCIAMMKPDGKPRGFGYVTLDSPEAATRAVDEPQKIDRRIVDVKRAVPGRDEKSKKEKKGAKEHHQEGDCCPCCGCKKNTGGDRAKSYCYSATGTTTNRKLWNSTWGYGWAGADEAASAADKAELRSSMGDASTPAFTMGGASTPAFVPGLALGDIAPPPGFESSIAPPPGFEHAMMGPPGLEHPTMRVSLFRTPSPSECSSRSSSPARSEVGRA